MLISVMKMDVYESVFYMWECHKFCLLIQLLSFVVFALGHLASRRQQEVLHHFIPVLQESASRWGLAAEDWILFF